MEETLSSWLGLGAETKNLTTLQMALRAVTVFAVTIVTVRVGQKRLMGRNTTLDFILAIILGSVASRAINGSAPLVPTLVTGFVLIGMHWMLSALAFVWPWFGKLVKGTASVVVQDGVMQTGPMRRLLVTHDDLHEDLRLQASVDDTASVQLARLERSGQLSVIPAKTGPTVLEVEVEAGVQTVRIELH